MILTLLKTLYTFRNAPLTAHDVMLVLLVMFDFLTSSNAETFSLVVPDGSISGQLGSSVVLPCALSPSLDCKDFEIQWYRSSDKDNPILLYKDLKVQESSGGRVSLVGDLQKGNVSLKLENLTLADQGEYVCYIHSHKWYEKANVSFTIPVVGSPPRLSLVEAEDQLNVTCTSNGWSPNTTLIWRDKGGELRNSVEHFTVDSEGLVSVSSWLLVSPSESEWISCSVGLSVQKMKAGKVLLLKPDSETLHPGWIAFIILLVITLVFTVMAIVCILKIRGPKGPKATSTEEEEAHPLVRNFSPLSSPVPTVREVSGADGATQTSGDFSPPPCPVSAVREKIRGYKSTETSGEFTPQPCPVSTVKERKRAFESAQTSGPETAHKETSTNKEIQGNFSPLSSPVPTVREVSGANGATQTSGEPTPQPCPVSTVKEKIKAYESTETSGEPTPQPCPVSPVKERNTADGATETSGPETAHKETSTDKEIQGNFSPLSSPVSTVREVSGADGATQTSGDFSRSPCPVSTVRERKRAFESTETSGEPTPPPCPVSPVKERNTADGSTQTSGPETAHKETSTDKEIQGDFNHSSPVSTVKELSRADGATQTSGEFNPPSIARTDAATKSEKETNEEEGNADFKMMIKCKVAIKPDPSGSRLGILFKERMRAGQYYWEVTGLTGVTAPAASFSDQKENECLKSWRVGVVSETVMNRRLPLTPQNSCWVLHYKKETGYYVNDPSLTNVLVRDRFSKLGVFLDCEKHTLSFYDREKDSHLYTFHNVDSTQPLVPVVFPGLRPQYSLEICEMNCVQCDELYQQPESTI